MTTATITDLFPESAEPTSPAPAAPAPATASEPERHGKHPVLSGLWTGFTYGLLALVLVMATLLIVVPKVAGGIPLTILSGSMEPNLPVGSLAVVVPVEPEDVRIGQVVTYLPNPDDPTPITHRVTGITHRADGGYTFTFQGDANAAPDKPVQDYQVRAKVLYAVPWLGHLNNAVNGENKHVALYVVAGGMFVWAGSLYWRAARNRRADAADAGAADAPTA
ncbi:signal peptidase I [Luteimicrobium sp. NPDC057192]|uniref:signal peptidase I n=1 Tax=Luteimicrobium sp. NPDC057192 TaxID=3346042 RepID=UPI003639E976